MGRFLEDEEVSVLLAEFGIPTIDRSKGMKEISGKEITIGILQDPKIGVMITFSLGGIFSDILGDISYRRAPVAKEEALKMMEEIEADKVLEDGDRTAVEEVLTKISGLGMEKKEIIEANIKLVLTDSGAAVVDSKIIVT